MYYNTLVRILCKLTLYVYNSQYQKQNIYLPDTEHYKNNVLDKCRDSIVKVISLQWPIVLIKLLNNNWVKFSTEKQDNYTVYCNHNY